MVTYRRLVLSTLVAALLPIHQMAAAAEAPVRIGWLKAPNDLTLAKAHGSIEKALAEKGIIVEWAGPFAAAAPAYEALNAGAIDITAGSSTATVTALAAKIPLAIFGYQKISATGEGILVKAGSPIVSLQDLRGRKVAVNRGGTGEYLLVHALEKNGIDPASVERVYLTPSDSGAAFELGHVDAWATWDPFLSIAKRLYGGRVLADGSAIASDNAVVLVADRNFAGRRHEVLQSIFDVIKSENTWAQQHPDEAGAIWVKEMGLPSDLAADIGAANAVPIRAVTSSDVPQLDAIADWYARFKIVPAKPDMKSGIIQLR